MKTLKRTIILFNFVFFINTIAQAQCNQAAVNLGNDTVLCPGQVLPLDLSSLPANTTVKWENGSTSRARTINSPGTYSVQAKYLGNNVVYNGNFSSGNIGFSSNYFPAVSGGAYGLLTTPGTYAITTSPSLAHNNFTPCGDHTGSGGNMLIVNGSNTPGVYVWCQTVNVTPGTNYEFSTWVTNALYESNVAKLQFSINGQTIGSPFTTTSSGCDWKQFFQIWNSGTSTTAQICILNLNTMDGGNDFAIDDISFSPVCISTDAIQVSYPTPPTFTLPVLDTACIGNTITLNAENPGYKYLWSTGATSKNINVSTSGNYTVNVSSNGYCGVNRTFNATFLSVPNFTLPTADTACVGQTIVLSAENPGMTYLWSTGATTQNISVTTSGNYTVQVKHKGRCTVIRTFTPKFLAYPTFALPLADTACVGDAITLNAENPGYNYLWSGGLKTQTLVVNTAGTYIVSVSNKGYCAVNRSITATFLAHPAFSLPIVDTACVGDLITFDAENAGYQYLWLTNETSQTIDVSTPGAYSVHVTNLGYCGVDRSFDAVFLANPAFTLPFSDTACINDILTLNAENTGYQYLWSTGETNQTIDVVNAGNYDVTVSNLGFCGVVKTFNANFLTHPSFTNPIVYNACEGDVITFNAENSSAGHTYLWSTGATTQAIDVTNTGTYVAHVTNYGFCGVDKSFDATFHQAPDAGNDTNYMFCNTLQQVDLFDHLANQTTSNAGTWYDNQNTEIPTGLFDFSQLTGIQNIDYVLTATHCPSDTANYILDIKKFNEIKDDVNLLHCNAGYLNLNLSLTQNYPGSWISNDGLALNNGTVSLQNLPKNTYGFMYIIQNEMPCPNDTAFVNINISEVPNVVFTADKLEGCSPLQVTFQDLTQVNGIKNYQWFVSGVPLGQNQNFNHTFFDAQCYDITLEITTDNLCTAQQTQANMICVNPDPIADFNYLPTDIYSNYPHVDFENTSTLNVSNQWTFEGHGESNEENPDFYFPFWKDNEYIVKLLVTSDKGCVDSISKVITVQEHVEEETIFYVPNAFTPDGDEHNNVFMPVMTQGVDIHEYYLKIQNRWGEIIFESNDYHIGWDGTLRGQLMQDGTYFWNIRFKERTTLNIIDKNGTVSLIR